MIELWERKSDARKREVRDEDLCKQFSAKFYRLDGQTQPIDNMTVKYYRVLVLKHGSSDPYLMDGVTRDLVWYPFGKCKLCQRKQRNWEVPTTVPCTLIMHVNGNVLNWSLENLCGVCKDCANGIR